MEPKTLFCTFLIEKSLGIVGLDSEESQIKSYLIELVNEFEQGNAELMDVSEFGGKSDEIISNQPSTIIQVMVSTGGIDFSESKKTKAELTQRAREILSGPNLQVTHSRQAGNVCYVGFTQL